MKIIDDTLKSRGKWSVGRLTMLATFIGNLAFAAWSVYKTGAMPDLPPNWLILISTMYGLNKAGQVGMAKAASNEPA